MRARRPPCTLRAGQDYITLKERCTAHIVSGAEGAPEGMATIDIAVEALKCAEYLTPLLQKALSTR